MSSFDGFGIDPKSPGLCAAGALLAYLYETQKSSLGHLSKLSQSHRGSFMLLDSVTRRSLELTRTLREGRREGSLLSTIDKTVTAGGARLLADWLSQPLVDIRSIERRQSSVGEWKEEPLAAAPSATS